MNFYQYDSFGNLVVVTDPVGNRTGVTDSFGAHTYTYDNLYRLIGVSDPMEAFTYDGVGNH